jgi:hypothetical protein
MMLLSGTYGWGVSNYKPSLAGGDSSDSQLIHTLYTHLIHTLLMQSLVAVALRCRLVCETPIYEQLRGERINAEVEPSKTALPRVGRPGRHRRLAETTSPIAMRAPLGPGADLVACQDPVTATADPPPGCC